MKKLRCSAFCLSKVTNDNENLKYNTAISALMTMLNEYEKYEDGITKDDYRVILHLLNPVAPHITEELNEEYKLGKVLCESPWPSYDETKTIDETYEMVVQVNGKVRGKLVVNANIDTKEMENRALEIDNVKEFTKDKQIVRIITVPGKLVNIVVK